MALTLEHAKQGGLASGQARRKLKARLAELQKELEATKAKQVLVAVEPIEVYTLKRLARVREQIDRLSELIESEADKSDSEDGYDPQAIDRLASALARLNEIERQLANRPLPGSLKPERPSAQARRMPRSMPVSTPPVVPDPPAQSQ